MKITSFLAALAVTTCASAQTRDSIEPILPTRDPAEPILPTIITIKPTLTRSFTLVTLSPRPTVITTPIVTRSCGPCPISTTSTVTLIYKRPPICPEYLCVPCRYLDIEKREEVELVEKRQLPTTTVLAPCCCATQPPTTTTITKDPCPNPCACAITKTVVPTCIKPSVTLY
ncbi:hypothetical protein TWF730_003726 [Orbilia blumenaviensis]|uniref:Uncharacterized protein n=1 Tax=Orbilia blumenaviensis TaxID=1796055 RepID=A0AAV9U3A7_9PEZI